MARLASARMTFAKFTARALAWALTLLALGATAAVAADATDPRAAGSALSWSSDVTGPARFVAVHGRRAAIFGYPEGGLEAWVYPVQTLSALRIAFRQQGASGDIDAQSIFRRIIY